MSDEPNRFVKFLDQLLPFLDAAPPWLKYWVYALVVINFLTAAGLAVYYLISKQTATEKGSLAYFSVEHPAANEGIPLGQSQNWMLSGTFPVTSDPELVKTADVTIEIFKLPERTAIPQQRPDKHISTVDGVWRYEPATFSGFGSYEIVVTAVLGRNSVYRTVPVLCSDKSSVYRQSIEREKAFRTVAEIPRTPQMQALVPQLKSQLLDLQNQFFAVYSMNPHVTQADLEKALDITNQALDLADSAVVDAPNDAELQNFRAYFLKDYAQVTNDLGQPEKSKLAFNESRLMFEAILEQEPNDPGAWNGLGDAFLAVGNPAMALLYINRALQIDKGYEYALNDKALAERQLAAQRAKLNEKR